VSVGIEDSLSDLVKRVEAYLREGYRRVKIKIKPGWDVEAVAMVRSRFGSIPLMVDANAAYSLADADHLARLDPYDLMMIEQPLDYDDIVDHAELQRGSGRRSAWTKASSARATRVTPSRWAPAGSSTSRLAGWVRDLPDGVIVAGAVRDEASMNLDMGAVQALQSLGASLICAAISDGDMRLLESWERRLEPRRRGGMVCGLARQV
jgi:hypothetical protein